MILNKNKEIISWNVLCSSCSRKTGSMILVIVDSAAALWLPLCISCCQETSCNNLALAVLSISSSNSSSYQQHHHLSPFQQQRKLHFFFISFSFGLFRAASIHFFLTQQHAAWGSAHLKHDYLGYHASSEHHHCNHHPRLVATSNKISSSAFSNMIIFNNLQGAGWIWSPAPANGWSLAITTS